MDNQFRTPLVGNSSKTIGPKMLIVFIKTLKIGKNMRVSKNGYIYLYHFQNY